MAAIAQQARVAFVRPDDESRARDAFLALAATGWLGYTYLYPSLNFAHATLPGCPFLAITGHPCPFCGGTRAFSAIWRGDFGTSLHLYPLGPLLFAACWGAAAYGIYALLSRRSLQVTLPQRVERWLTVVGVGLLSGSWALKLVLLGN